MNGRIFQLISLDISMAGAERDVKLSVFFHLNYMNQG